LGPTAIKITRRRHVPPRGVSGIGSCLSSADPFPSSVSGSVRRAARQVDDARRAFEHLNVLGGSPTRRQVVPETDASMLPLNTKPTWPSLGGSKPNRCDSDAFSGEKADLATPPVKTPTSSAPPHVGRGRLSRRSAVASGASRVALEQPVENRRRIMALFRVFSRGAAAGGWLAVAGAVCLAAPLRFAACLGA
jgi:hypothetical protein